jgi:hypothetical protein
VAALKKGSLYPFIVDFFLFKNTAGNILYESYLKFEKEIIAKGREFYVEGYRPFCFLVIFFLIFHSPYIELFKH